AAALVPLLGTGFVINVLAAMAGVFLVAVATGVGLRLLELRAMALVRERFDSPLERMVLAAALGVGALSLAVFVLGSLGLLSPWFWWPFVAAAGACGWRPLAALSADLQSAARGFWREAHPVAIGAVVLTAAWCLAHVPLVWASPLEYDVLEYHLGAVAQYLRDGRVSFLQENVYATFPENGEMLYLLSMILGTGKWQGLPTAHLTLMAAWIVTVCGVYALTARLVRACSASRPSGRGRDPEDRATAAALGALLYALVPLGSQVAADFYVEHFQALFHLGALMAACAFLGERRAGVRDRFGWLVLGGLLAGLCCGTKYTALLFTLLPLLLLVPALCAIGGSVYEGLRAGGCLTASAAVAFAPWLLRNLIMSDDPLHPLGLVLKRRIQGGGDVPDRIDHFEVAHRAGARSLSALGRSLAQLWPSLRHQDGQGENLADALFWSKDAECGPQLLCFAVPGLLRIVQSEVFLVAGVFALDVAAWFLFTHRINRFMYPLLAPLAVLGAAGIARLWQLPSLRKPVVAIVVAAALLVGPLPMVYVCLMSRPAHIAGREDARQAAREQYRLLGQANWYDAWEAVNALPEGSKTLFLGDAQTFYLDRTPAYAVVFSPPLLEEVLKHTDSAPEAARALLAHGVTHVYINYPEWFRLDSTYALSRPSPREPWQLATMDKAYKDLMRELLCSGHIAAYGAAWPEGIYPAYLELSPQEYSTLEEVLAEFTVVEHTWRTKSGWPSCELRRLKVEALFP
ncbi:MAG: hypothetical protein NTW87_18460, partial [Planctomycetota bacterium]|nr:hypothetical protein [Planctomycetota bacterium]